MSQKLVQIFESGLRVPGYFFDEKTNVIYHLKSISNKKIKFSCRVKMPQIVAAKRFANQELARILGKKKSRITPLISDELKLYLKLKESENLDEAGTMKNVRNAVKRIEPFWGSMFPYEINRDNLAEWYAWLDITYPSQQKENPIKYMRNFCRYLAEKVINGVPLLPAVPKITDPHRKDIKASRQRKKLLIMNANDFKKIYHAGNEDERMVALFMYTMGTRIEETLSLRFGTEVLLDVATPLYRWSIGQNKADHVGEHALHPALLASLKEMRKRSASMGTDFVFPQKGDHTKHRPPQGIYWDDWRSRAAIGWHWTSHTFRHTCLSNLFNDEKNPQALICKLYRVSLAVALEVYIKPTESGREKMRAAIEVNL